MKMQKFAIFVIKFKRNMLRIKNIAELGIIAILQR